MRKCIFCQNEIPETRQKSAKYCSDLCKTKAHRQKHGIPEPFSPIFRGQKEFICCEGSTFFRQKRGDDLHLVCKNCGSKWLRVG